jgi:hypothetical protein
MVLFLFIPDEFSSIAPIFLPFYLSHQKTVSPRGILKAIQEVTFHNFTIPRIILFGFHQCPSIKAERKLKKKKNQKRATKMIKGRS